MKIVTKFTGMQKVENLSFKLEVDECTIPCYIFFTYSRIPALKNLRLQTRHIELLTSLFGP